MAEILAKDAQDGYYKTQKGRIIELVRSMNTRKWDNPKPSSQHVPYRAKGINVEILYGWIPPNYKLIELSESDWLEIKRQEITTPSQSTDKVTQANSKPKNREYYLVCPYCLMLSNDIVLVKTARKGIQIDTCERCKRQYMVRAVKTDKPDRLFYFVDGKARQAVAGRNPRNIK